MIFLKVISDRVAKDGRTVYLELNELLTQGDHSFDTWRDRTDRAHLVSEVEPYISLLSREQGVKDLKDITREPKRLGCYAFIPEHTAWLSMVRSSLDPVAGHGAPLDVIQCPDLSLFTGATIHIYYFKPMLASFRSAFRLQADRLKHDGLSHQAMRRYEEQERLRMQLIPKPEMIALSREFSLLFPSCSFEFHTVNELAEVTFTVKKKATEKHYDALIARLIDGAYPRDLGLHRGGLINVIEDELFHETTLDVVRRSVRMINMHIEPYFSLTLSAFGNSGGMRHVH